MNERETHIFLIEIRILFEDRASAFGLECAGLNSGSPADDLFVVTLIEPISRWDRKLIFCPVQIGLLRCSLKMWVDSGLEEARKSFWGQELVDST